MSNISSSSSEFMSVSQEVDETKLTTTSLEPQNDQTIINLEISKYQT